MFSASGAIRMAEETHPFSLPYYRLAAPAKQVLQRKRSTDAMGGMIDNRNAGNSLRSHQFSGKPRQVPSA
jgi:hypothetical protein